MQLTDYKILTFDCYGTLIGWESGIWDAFQPLLMANQFTQCDRQGLSDGDNWGATAAVDFIFSDIQSFADAVQTEIPFIDPS